MKTFTIASRLGVVCLMLLALTPRTFAQADEFPTPEHLIENGDASRYADAALDFLKTHPDSEFAPRVAFDLLMLAAVSENKIISDEMKTKLILDYPQSLPGAYLRSTFAKEEDFRAFLSELTDRFAEKPSEDFPKKFRRALSLGVTQFSNDLLRDKNFLLRSALLLGAADDTKGMQQLLTNLPTLTEHDDTLKKIAALTTDDKTTNVEKVAALHRESGNKTALFLSSLFLSRLSKTDAELPAMRHVTAEKLLNYKKFGDALPLLEQLPTETDGDKILFQRMWCYASMKNTASLTALQTQLDEKFPQSPWRDRAMELSQSVKNLDANAGLYADTLHALVADVKKNFDAFEGTVLFSPKDSGKNFTVYVAFVASENFFEIQIREGEELIFAYKSAEKESALFVKGETEIRRFLQSGPVPSPTLNLDRTKDGKYHFSGGVQFQSSNEAAASGRTLLDSAALSTRDGAMDLLRYAGQQGMLLADAADTEKGKSFTLLFPEILEPKFSAFHLLVSKENQLTALKTDGFECRDVHYGAAKTIKLSPPVWPEIKTATEENFDAAFFFKVVSKMVELFAPSKKF